MKGWGPKSSIRPSKPRESNFLGGISRDFAGISRGRPKSLRKKSLGSIFVPYRRGPQPCVSLLVAFFVGLGRLRNYREGWAPEPVRVSLEPLFVAENPWFLST